MAYDSKSASQEDDSKFEEDEDEISSKHSSECVSSCSDSNEEQQDEEESEQGTESIISVGGLSSTTFASQNTALINLVHNLHYISLHQAP